MTLRVLVAAVVAAALLGPGSRPAAADHGWGNYHWARSGDEARVQVVDSVTSEWDATLQRAVARWNRSPVLRGVIAAGSVDDRRSCTAVPGKIRVCNAAYGTSDVWNGTVGLTTIRTDSAGHLLQAQVRLNETYLKSRSSGYGYLNDPTAWREVVCHELGHAFGLDHNDGSGSCLRAVIRPGGFFPNPNGHDYDQLLIQYHQNRTDGRTSLAPTTEETIPGGPQSPQTHEHGDDHIVRVRDLGNGVTEITIIRRVPEQPAR